MSRTWKAIGIAGALALIQVVLLGFPGQAAAWTITPVDLNLVISDIATTDLIQIGSNGLTMGGESLNLSETGSTIFQFNGSDVMLGGVRPPVPGPGPIGDGGVPLYYQFTFYSGSDVMLGGVRPPVPGPGPIGDGSGALLKFDGLVVLAGTLGLNFTSGGSFTDGDRVVVMSSTDGFSGSFGTVPPNFTLDVLAPNTLGVNTTPSYLLVATYHAPVPEPSTMLLLGSGLSGLVGIGIRRRRKSAAK